MINGLPTSYYEAEEFLGPTEVGVEIRIDDYTSIEYHRLFAGDIWMRFGEAATGNKAWFELRNPYCLLVPRGESLNIVAELYGVPHPEACEIGWCLDCKTMTWQPL